MQVAGSWLAPARNTALPASIVPLAGCVAWSNRLCRQKGDSGSCSALLSRTLASKEGFPFIDLPGERLRKSPRRTAPRLQPVLPEGQCWRKSHQ
jgi:hypothetical protein